jgi:membrane protein
MSKAFASRQWTRRTARLWQQVSARTDHWPQTCYRAAIGFSEHEGFMAAAAIAYYAFLSIFPLSILLLAITRRLLQPDEAVARYLALLNYYLPGATDFLQINYAPLQGHLTILRITALLTLAWSGSGIFAVTGRLLDRAWHIKQTGRLLVQRRLMALPMAVTALLLIALLLVGSTVVHLLNRFEFLDDISWLTQAVSLAAILVLNTLLFALAYWSLPSAQVNWREVLPGSILASILWEGAKIGFTTYLSHLRWFDVIYGSVTAVVAFFLWAYLSGCIVLFCGELNAEYGRRRRVSRPGYSP